SPLPGKKATKNESSSLTALRTLPPWLPETAALPAEVRVLLHLPDELSFLAAALLAGLLVERRALDVARQAFLLAGLLETLEELVETLVHPDFDADQALTSYSLQDTSTSGIIARPFGARQQIYF